MSWRPFAGIALVCALLLPLLGRVPVLRLALAFGLVGGGSAALVLWRAARERDRYSLASLREAMDAPVDVPAVDPDADEVVCPRCLEPYPAARLVCPRCGASAVAGPFG